jgi:hypothetical protein
VDGEAVMNDNDASELRGFLSEAIELNNAASFDIDTHPAEAKHKLQMQRNLLARMRGGITLSAITAESIIPVPLIDVGRT